MFDWREFLELAELLAGPAGDSVAVQLSEATHRSAVSRAYYAAFCHARRYAQRNLGYLPRYTAADHGSLRRHYDAHGLSAIADDLDKLRDWRNECDYDDVVVDLGTKLADGLEKAEAVIQAL